VTLPAHSQRARAGRTSLITLVSVVLAAVPVIVQAQPAAAQTLKPGFTLATSPNPNLESLTNIVFLPGTSPPALLAIGKCGGINKGVMQGGSVTNTSWTTVGWPSQGLIGNGDPRVCDLLDRGLVGIDVDGSTVYLLYDYEDTGSECPGHPPASVHPIFGRLTRLTAVNDFTSLVNEQILVDCLPSFSTYSPGVSDDSHTVGTVLVAPDHTLFAGVGDGSSYGSADPSALNAQDPNSPRGKIFHINPDGTPAAGNPFGASGNYWAQRVFAYGLRNPFRFSLQPGTNRTLYIGDVGWNDWEEIDVATGGENFGWPCWEGPLGFRQEYADLTVGGQQPCQQQYANPPSNLRAPLYYWDHTSVQAGGHGALGGVFASGSPYGAYSGAYFFADFAANRMWAFQQPGSAGRLLGLCSGEAFACDLQLDAIPVVPVAMRQGPNGDIFLADIMGNRVVELKGCTGNCPPVASGFVDPVASKVPGTNFRFDASASFDSDGSIVSYHWNFDDGHSANGQVVFHQYPVGFEFDPTLTVTDDDGATDTVSMHVWTNHNLPTLTLIPNKSGPYVVGEKVTVTASARDENNAPIGGDSISWAPVLHHCPAGVASGQCHIHPMGASTGSSLSMVLPDHGDDSYIEFKATATDGNGLSVTKSFNVPMDEHTIALDSVPSGATISVNGGGGPTPLNAKAITNSVNQLIAPPTYNGLPFLHWSDGDANPTKSFTMPAADVSFTAIYAPGPVTPSGTFTSVIPYRLFDTRDASQNPFGTDTPLEPGQTLTVDLSTQTGPPNRTAALLNVTTDQPAAAGYVRAFPCGQEPNTSTVNFDPGQTAANLAMVKIPASGQVCFTSLVPTHLVVDVAGWFSPATQNAGDGYVTVDPVRVLDTRQSTPLAAGDELRFSLAGQSGFPSNASAVLLNLTATEPDGPGYVKVYPCGEENTVSNVNYVAGQTVANLAAVKVAPGGDVCFRSFATTQLVVDLAGWYVPGAPGAFSASDPIRLFDSRQAAVVSRLAAGEQVPFQMSGTALVPGNATSIALNVTATHPDDPGYVKVYPCGADDPLVSNVNYRANQEAAANLAVVKLPADGRICFKSFASTDLVVDLAGWYTG
jgi:Glucose / Sorbosone dehydrogenase/PKD domain